KAAQASAREQAIQDARAKAEAMARTAGVALGKVVSVNDVGTPATVDAFKMAIPAPSTFAALTAQVPAGQLDVVVRVQVQFEIG
ncbi:MAG: DUF541 domain-containing protein, partial [Chloroflexi bacterium]